MHFPHSTIFFITALTHIDVSKGTLTVAAADAITGEIGAIGTSCTSDSLYASAYQASPGNGLCLTVGAVVPTLTSPIYGVIDSLLSTNIDPQAIINSITSLSLDVATETVINGLSVTVYNAVDLRQYACVDLQLRAAGYTGVDIQDYYTQLGFGISTGWPYPYTPIDIQGLYGSDIVYSAQGDIVSATTVTTLSDTFSTVAACDLAERLYLSLQAVYEDAGGPIGDVRCFDSNGSSGSTIFLHVDDSSGNTIIHIETATPSTTVDPWPQFKADYLSWRASNSCAPTSSPSVSRLPSTSPTSSIMPTHSDSPSTSSSPTSHAASPAVSPVPSVTPSTSLIPTKSDPPSTSSYPTIYTALPAASSVPSVTPSASLIPTKSDRPSISPGPTSHVASPAASPVPSVTPSTSLIPTKSDKPSRSSSPTSHAASSAASPVPSVSPSTSLTPTKSDRPSTSSNPTSHVAPPAASPVPSVSPSASLIPTKSDSPSKRSSPTSLSVSPTASPTKRPASVPTLYPFTSITTPTKSPVTIYLTAMPTRSPTSHPSTSAPVSSAPTKPLNVYYPDWQGTNTCVNNGKQPSWMYVSDPWNNKYFTTSQQECCDTWYFWDLRCVLSAVNAYADNYTGHPWYPDWQNSNTCQSDGRQPTWMYLSDGIVWEGYYFSQTQEECCNTFFSWDLKCTSAARSAEEGPSLSSNPWYPDYASTQTCVSDGKQPSWMGDGYLKDSKKECCKTFYWWDSTC
ncbi:hypothetical protein ACHAW6_010842 [Cyclotella cf. meneghiniana]